MPDCDHIAFQFVPISCHWPLLWSRYLGRIMFREICFAIWRYCEATVFDVCVKMHLVVSSRKPGYICESSRKFSFRIAPWWTCSIQTIKFCSSAFGKHFPIIQHWLNTPKVRTFGLDGFSWLLNHALYETHLKHTIYTYFLGITDNIYNFGRSFLLLLVLPIHQYFYPSTTGFTWPNDRWTGLKAMSIPTCYHHWCPTSKIRCRNLPVVEFSTLNVLCAHH